MNNKGKLIVIDGIDGCGKTTQLNMLADYYKNKGKDVRIISFPNYESHTGKCIKEDYLEGKINNPDKLSEVYGSSMLYSMDRYVSFYEDWKKDYDAGKIIITARYTSSNLIHQLSKIQPEMFKSEGEYYKERLKYIDWLGELEYKILNLPVPTLSIYLLMSVDNAESFIEQRYKENGGHKDIHEKDINYMTNCARAMYEVIDLYKNNLHYYTQKFGHICALQLDNGYSSSITNFPSKETIHKSILKIINNCNGLNKK